MSEGSKRIREMAMGAVVPRAHLTEGEKGREMTAEEVAEIIRSEKGEQFHANFNGIWDRCTGGDAKVVQVNRGNGFEDAVAVEVDEDGIFFYFGTFNYAHGPSATEMFGFYADGGFFVKGV